MHYGFRVVEDWIDGLSNWMDEKGFHTIDDFRGLSLPKVTEWKHLDLNYKIVARINEVKCIGCQLCYTACWDGAHQCIYRNAEDHGDWITSTPMVREISHSTDPARIPWVDEDECVGCNLCVLVCPVEGCITMERVERGMPFQSWAQRTESA
jgi:dihydropyrimidine dehydrogenase (NAD+) subunit PreA